MRVSELPVRQRQRNLSTVLTVSPGGSPKVPSAYLGDAVVVAPAPPIGMADGDSHATTPARNRANPPPTVASKTVPRRLQK